MGERHGLDKTHADRQKYALTFAPFRSSKNRPHTYYRINVRNFSVFYAIIDDTMEVRRVLYVRRDLDKLLND
jgi:toxin ParE1/3/4